MLALRAVHSLPRLAKWTVSLALVVAMLCCAPTHGTETSQPTADELYTSACSAYRESDWALAAEKFAEFVQRFPKEKRHHVAQLYRSESLAQEQRWPEVLLQLQELRSTVTASAIPLSEENERQVAFRIAESYFFTQQLTQARENLAAFLRQYPHDRRTAIVLLYDAEAALAQDDFAAAHRSCQALSKETDDKSILTAGKLLSAKALVGLDQSEGAIALYENVLGDETLDAAARANGLLAMARLHVTIGHRKEAIQQLQQLTTISPALPEAVDIGLYELSFLQQQAGDTAAAKQNLHRLLQEYPESALHFDAQYRAALLAMDCQDWDEALSLLPDFQTPIASHPLSQRIALLRAEVLGHKNEWAKAAEVLDPLLKESLPTPEANAAEYWRAEAAYRLADFPRALELLESLDDRLHCSQPPAKTASLDSTTQRFHATVVLRRAQTLAQLKQYGPSQEMLQAFFAHYKASRLSPQAHYLQAQLHVHHGQYAQGRDSLANILEDSRLEDPQTHLMAQWLRGESYRLEERYDSAITAFSKITSQDQFPVWQANAYYHLGLCHEALKQQSQAVAAYQQVTTHFASSPFVSKAQERLATVKLELARKDRRPERFP